MQQNCLLSDSNYRWKSDNSNDSIQNIKSHELLVQNPITKIDNAQQNQKDCQENFGHAQHWYFCLRTNKILIIILDGFFLEVFCHCYQFLIVLCCYNFLNLSLEIFLVWNSCFPGENKTIYKKKVAENLKKQAMNTIGKCLSIANWETCSIRLLF